MRSSIDVHNFLQDSGVDHEIVLIDGDPRGLDEAAALCDLPACRLAETHLFEVDGSPVMVLTPGGSAVDSARVAEAMGAESVRPLPLTEVRRLTGFAPGAVPPIATETQVPLVVDSACAPQQEDGCVYTSAGDRGAILKMRFEDLMAVRRDGRLFRITG